MATDTLKQRAQQASRHRKLDSRRLWLVLIFFTVFAGYNTWKIFSVQVLDYSKLSTMAEGRIKWKDTLTPRRGQIYDSRGQLLAGNTTAEDVYVDKTHSTDEELHKIADLLAPALGRQPGDIYTSLKESPITRVLIAKRLNDADTAKVQDVINKNPAVLKYIVALDMQPMRSYPANTLASSVLGFTDSANAGQYGIEEYYNSKLAGEAGWIIAEHDAFGRPLVLQQPQTQPAVDGSDVVLTIDSAVQYMAERELKRSIEEFKADSGYVIVQNPNTGGILAMSNFPTFNPNDFTHVTDYSLFKNTAVNNVVEPGSTMKILTYSSSIDAGAVTSNTSFYGSACVQKYGWRLCNATFTEWGNQTMTQGLGRSDNIASMYAAEKLGERRFYDYTRLFGIGQRTGIDLSGEVSGIITYPEDDGYSPINLYTNSFGQGVATTPIQLINAVSAVANGGLLLKPHVMQEIKQGDKVVEQFDTKEMRRVIKPETAHDIANMLAYGVENKLVARFAAVPGYHVSVKTGTAQLPDSGGYAGAGSLASAMGFAPSQNAKFTLYIAFFNPKTSQWGENTASVSWGRLAKELLLYMNVQPTEPIPTSTPIP